jgi:hypothetical protein
VRLLSRLLTDLVALDQAGIFFPYESTGGMSPMQVHRVLARLSRSPCRGQVLGLRNIFRDMGSLSQPSAEGNVLARNFVERNHRIIRRDFGRRNHSVVQGLQGVSFAPSRLEMCETACPLTTSMATPCRQRLNLRPLQASKCASSFVPHVGACASQHLSRQRLARTPTRSQ